jgi:PAS domain S-box-containing protein
MSYSALLSTLSSQIDEDKTRVGNSKLDDHTNTEFEFPVWLLLITAIVCFVPLLNFWGVNLASVSMPIDVDRLAQWKLPTPHLYDEMYYALRGATHHALLEWSAVVIAFVCIAMAFTHYNISKDITALVLGMALILSASMDSIHTLAATRVIDAIADNNNLIPFTWAVSRSINASVLLIGGALILLTKRQRLTLGGGETILLSILLLFIVYLFSSWMVDSEYLPKTQFPDALITRPYDVLPLLLFVACLPLFGLLYWQNRNYLTAAILIGLFPGIGSESYMVFGSSQLFDHYFNSAHMLKLCSYALPILGFMMDYRATFIQRQQEHDFLFKLNNSLEESQYCSRTINDLLPVGLLIVDDLGIITYANRYAMDMFKYSESELVGSNVEDLVPGATRIKDGTSRGGYQSRSRFSHIAETHDNFVGLTLDNKEVALEISLGSVTLQSKPHSLVTLLNISERKRLMDSLQNSNQQMDQAIDELTQSNEQLERFAFVCSHDLQEPVRMVESFSQLLEERYKEQLDVKGLEYLKYITDGAQRAREMISDILTFCRLDQSTTTLQEVELVDTCKQVHKTIEINLNKYHGRFCWVEPLPVLNAIPTQIFQLVLNLVTNGLKFNRCDAPCVTVSAEKTNGYWNIKFKDNGIGIKQKYQEKIFDIFEQLNSKIEFSGTGVGLAICKKIVDKNSAAISVESEVGEGTSFFIKWPIEGTREKLRLAIERK